KAKDIVAGSFFRCRASIELPDVRIYCYRDDPFVDINIEYSPGDRGDGFAGSIWPTGSGGFPPADAGPFGDVNATHDVLTASYNAGADTLSLSGCLIDEDGANSEGHVYWSTADGTDIDLLTGYGEIDIWLNQDIDDCTGDSPSGDPVYDNAAIYPGIQGDFVTAEAGVAGGTSWADHYDQDLDGVPNSRELADDDACGRRDPYNRYDYYDVSIPKDGVIDLPNDILGVIIHFAPGGYSVVSGYENWDRPRIMDGGAIGSTWTRGAPDGVIDLPNDILGVILQFNPGGCGL
ncbi:MAG: hypothetical protein J4N98_05525, partial [Chloroflexi bacterium]|nr:hypothetical protein [Chloroflexota bacterium]